MIGLLKKKKNISRRGNGNLKLGVCCVTGYGQNNLEEGVMEIANKLGGR